MESLALMASNPFEMPDQAMQTMQWIIAAITATFVAVVALFQWRTAQQKAVLDLFERRHAIYEIVRNAVGTMGSNSNSFDQAREVEFMQAMERAYFFFGDELVSYLEKLWSDMMDVRTVDQELSTLTGPDRTAALEKRRAALTRIAQFHRAGMPVFAKYMRFSQTMPFQWRKSV